MAALSHTQQTTIKREDHLCCGNLGRMELFCVASQKMQNVEWYQIARQQVSAVVARANNAGSYGLFTTDASSNLYNPGFFRGMAGIGYQLLRVAYPDQLPSILLLE
jgi:lantibiotic modifying enzyme